MGQKVNPIGLRIGIIENWRSRWYAGKDYSQLLEEDINIRRFITEKLANAYLSKIEIERTGETVTVDIYTARPGIVIGRKGKDVDSLKSELEKITDKQIQINIQEVTRPELDATLVATNIAEQLSARVSFRRAMKRAVSNSLRAGAKGIKVSCAGRLGGAEMARTEWYREGRVPLHTLRARIDYGFVEAHTTMGRIGVKVWIYKGSVDQEEEKKVVSSAKAATASEETIEEVKPKKAKKEVKKIKEVKEEKEKKPTEEVKKVEKVEEVESKEEEKIAKEKVKETKGKVKKDKKVKEKVEKAKEEKKESPVKEKKETKIKTKKTKTKEKKAEGKLTEAEKETKSETKTKKSKSGSKVETKKSKIEKKKKTEEKKEEQDETKGLASKEEKD